jgi:hypothetical protein
MYTPQIYSFTSSPGSVQSGQTSTLSWNVANADTVTISPSVGPVPAAGSVVVMPNDTTTYTLYAYNMRGLMNVGNAATAAATVYVAPYAGAYAPVYSTPVIGAFTSNPNYIQPGQPTSLNWAVTNADSVTISPSVGTVPNTGAFQVNPASTTTYTLSAYNSSGTVNAATTVTVAPVVNSYVTPPYSNNDGTVAGTAQGTAPGANSYVTPPYSNSDGTVSVIAHGTAPAGTPNTGRTGGTGTAAVDLLPFYLMLLGLVAVASIITVALIVRKPAAQVARSAGTSAGQTVAAATVPSQPATLTPVTMPVEVGMAARLISSTGTTMPVIGGPLGRRNFQALTSPDMAGTISRQHLRITFEDRRFFIEDLGSTNGTRVNGSEIRGTGRRPIEDGDDIEVAGALKMTFRI